MAQSIEAYFDETKEIYMAQNYNTHATTVQTDGDENEGFFENIFEGVGFLGLMGFILVVALVVYFIKRL